MSSINERPQDPSSALEQATQDVANLKSEFHHIMDEMQVADKTLVSSREQYLREDYVLHKLVKQHGSLTKDPKEGSITETVEKEMKRCGDLQQQKCILANTALYLVTKHLSKIKANIESLEEDGLLAPLDDELSDKKAGSVDLGAGIAGLGNGTAGSGSSSGRKRPASSSSANGKGQKRKQQKKERSRSHQRAGTVSRDVSPNAGIGRDPTFDALAYNDDLFKMNQGGEEDDKQLYCFCQRVSYGEMVACDGPNCKYEWFHYSCVNLTEPPKGQWYCPECRLEIANQKLNKKKKKQ
ncbi:histone acetyltransferase YNG2 [Kluyveromyces lactis]|uniref:Chromatin modification-related protein YNG2 n=1 Tax=Kluyveromyces lactis (strain ATCC 8585 / CBS 2359 / DSM 70799 / NBRC 1267 / NRRL Y-1140 / WM37) TaxID=284590 RepID=YNG2_KLULA|nr:uncharacterized protein KLLA0_A06974g [Kluyveromyces lactis]Q6CXN0.1 RecName: Full=Chromatin modification-related protein YNG2; AltName: Full=ING1 homolog 2 [Kluyveromyces lactis NRRL Y-1140]CAH02897.1 KLLA0A06974p [Kluyveromyces lactis]|eukprot:XP_451309.1 uncharacterized protein KLLA0_A06974g [Kluyveromyces lactis]